MDENNTLSDTPDQVAATVSNYQTDRHEPNIHKALANIDTTMGKMASLLEKLVAEKAGEPLQGDSPTGRKRQSAEPEDASGYDSESKTASFRSRGKRQCRNMSPDAISVHTGDSEDEVAQLLGGTTSNNEVIAPEAQDILDKPAKGFSDTDYIAGPKIVQSLADIALKRWGQQLKVDKLKSIFEKYTRPENCPGMICKKVNHDVWQLLSSKSKGTDIQLYNLQHTLVKVIVATLQTTNAIVNKKSIGNDPQPLGNMVDAIAMLAHAHAMLTQFRKEQIKLAIN